MKVRCNINLAVLGPAESVHDVDETDPLIQGLLAQSYVDQVEDERRWFCTKCNPPTMWETEAGRDLHYNGDVHDTADSSEGRTTSRRAGRDGPAQHSGPADPPAPPPDGR